MLCAYAAAVGGDDPIFNLRVGELPDTEPRSGEVVVEVRAAALNHHDLWTLQGVASRPVIPPQVLGCDAAGVVVETGEGGLAAGTRVVVHSVLGCGECPACLRGDTHLCRRVGILSEPGFPGALTTRLVVPAANVIPVPGEVAFEAAACLPTAYLTAYHAVFARAGCKSGDTLLIHGASGGVATAAMLLAKARGIRVWATSRSREKGEAVVAAGLAERSFVTDVGAAKGIMGASKGNGVDAVLDSVGAATWELSLKVLRPGGTLVNVGVTGGANPPAQLNRIFWKHLTIAGSSMGEKHELEELVAMVSARTFVPLIDSTVDLADTEKALRRLAEGRALGKLVVRVTAD